MRAKLCRSGQGGQRRNGGEFPLAPVEDVIGKDGAEEVILEVRVDVGREGIHGARNGTPHQFGLRFRTDLVQIGALGQRCGLTADRIFQACGFSFVQKLHVDAECRETARKSGIGIHLFEHGFDFVDGETIVEPLGKCLFELFLIAVGGKAPIGTMLASRSVSSAEAEGEKLVANSVAAATARLSGLRGFIIMLPICEEIFAMKQVLFLGGKHRKRGLFKKARLCTLFANFCL